MPVGTADVDAFVKLLGDTHGALQPEAQLDGGLLLQRTGDERGRRPAGGALGGDGGDGEGRRAFGVERADVGHEILRGAFGVGVVSFDGAL